MHSPLKAHSSQHCLQEFPILSHPGAGKKQYIRNMGDASDILPVLQYLTEALEPYAKRKNISLHFTSDEPHIKFVFPVDETREAFTKLIRSIIDFMTEGYAIYVSASILPETGVSIRIRNTGINLKMVNGIRKNSVLPLSLINDTPFETTFEVCYSLQPTETKPAPKNGEVINYMAVVKGIQTHFSKFNNSLERLAATKPKEAAFLTSINQCISEHMEDERFDANALSTAMAMSRAQLLRRLKSLTGNSPGFYIKTMRLERAKILLETTDISISEAAFQTGFGTPSNFSKVFAEKYGITPSQFRRANPDATNK